MKKINVEKLIELKENGMSDKEAAEYFDATKSAVSRLRKHHHEIPGGKISSVSTDIVHRKLKSMGFNVRNMKKVNSSCPYDLLVNDMRIEVRGTTRPCHDGYRFVLADGSHTDVVESETQIKLPNGKLRKLFRETCDFIIFVGGEDKAFWVMNSNHLPDTLTAVGLSFSPYSKYYPYYEAWHRLRGSV